MSAEESLRNEQDTVRGTSGDLPDLSYSMELVHKVQAKDDRQALNELFERYKPRLRRIVRVKLGTRLQRHLDEEDILQEVFLVAMRKLPALELRSQASIIQWLSMIALNEIRNKVGFYNAQKRDQERERRIAADSGTSQAAIRLAATGPSPSQKAQRAEFEELVDTAVQGLEPPEYRDVIMQRDYYERSWEEVRAELGRPTPEAAQELYRRAHRKLRERLRKHLGS